MRWKNLCLAMSVLLGPVGLAQSSAPPDSAADAPAAAATIPIRLGSVDAVQGGLHLKVPIGPRLPGRIPLGFVWTLSAREGLRSDVRGANLGGSFRPVEWPDLAKPTATYTVTFQGEALVFLRKTLRPTPDPGLPTANQLYKLLTTTG